MVIIMYYKRVCSGKGLHGYEIGLVDLFYIEIQTYSIARYMELSIGR